MIIGNKKKLAFELKKIDEMVGVEVWMAGFNVSSNDTKAYGKQFAHYLQLDKEKLAEKYDEKIVSYINNLTLDEISTRLLSYNLGDYNIDTCIDDVNLKCRILELGPTMDHLCCFLIPFEEKYYLQCFIFDAKYDDVKKIRWLTTEININELATVIEDTINLVRS